MTTTIDNLKQRTEFAKRYITDILKETGLCIYGVNKETKEIYIADRHDVCNGTAKFAMSINIEDLNQIFNEKD